MEIFKKIVPLFITLCCSLLLNATANGTEKKGIKVLVVTAHPDDETGMAVTIYKITHELNGTVDQCVITNGEAGYKYSTLSESYYNLELTDEAIGRQHLPRIRKQELMNAGKVIGMNNIFFLDQKDAHYGLDEREPLDTTWNVQLINTRLKEILTVGKYDFIFCLLPTAETHAHHKAATLLALRAVKNLPDSLKPIILACTVSSKSDTATQKFSQLKNYTETAMFADSAVFHTDRTAPFGFKNKLNYKMIANWEIAEHKSQGTMQLYMNMGDSEDFWFFKINSTATYQKCIDFFEGLKAVPYKTKNY
jgi:LmbE family N-acetylglucosaminyl deacetylase